MSSLIAHCVCCTACRGDYQTLIEGSEYCFKKVDERLNFAEARKRCGETYGDLATFHNVKERDHFRLNTDYKGYMFGYTRTEGGRCIVLFIAYNSRTIVS